MTDNSSSPRKNRYSTDFGTSISVALSQARLTQRSFANSIEQSASYVNQIITGRKAPSPRWVEKASDVLSLSSDARQELHILAAKMRGFRLD
jgi:ribosome-binding protein aMBF1 (putative translation factor)